MPLPEPLVLHIPGDARQEIERSCRVADKIADMAAVTVGVEVGRKDEVHAVFVKNRHPDPAGFGKTFGPGFGTAGKAVLQRIFMHEDDFPFFPGGCHVPAEPGNLVFCKVRFPWLQFFILRVQDDKMDVAHIIGIELVPVVLRVT